MTYTKEQILEAFKKLPEDVKEAMFSVDTAEILRVIGERNDLMIDKIGEMADETGLVMLGLTHPSEFVAHLSERLGLEKEKVREIAEEINSKIFFPIRENLKKIHGIAPTETSESTAQSPTSEPLPPPPATAPEPIPPAPAPMSEPPIIETVPPPAPTGASEPAPAEPPKITEKSEKPPEPVPSGEIKKVDPYREQVA